LRIKAEVVRDRKMGERIRGLLFILYKSQEQTPFLK
jgi:hypothetical protein